MTIKALFDNQFNEILTKYKGRKVALFFKGFGPLQNKTILSCSDSLIPFEKVLNDDNTLNIHGIDSQKKNMVGQMSFSDRQLVVGIYEQLISIFNAVSDIKELYDGKIIIIENNLFDRFSPCCISKQTARQLYDYYQQEEKDLSEELKIYTSYYGDVLSLDETHYFVSLIDKHTDEKLLTTPFFTPEEASSIHNLAGSNHIVISDRSFNILKNDIINGEIPTPTTFIVDTKNEETRSRFRILIGILNQLGISYGIELYNRFDTVDISSGDRFLPILQKHWGSNAFFRPLKFYKNPEFSNETTEITQGDIICQIIAQSEQVLSGSKDFKNIFITAPTGAGKSLLFQIPAIHLAEQYNAVTIVITPLIALMKDQVNQLEQEHDVSYATFLNSTITYEERERRINEIKAGTKSIVYLAPELLIATPLDNIIGKRPIGLVVVDEAHTVTSWGKDFRSDYWYLGDFLTKLKRNDICFPVLCLTATAVYGGTEDVVNETIESLSLDMPIIYLGNVRRNNIRFDIHQLDRSEITGGFEEFKIKHTAKAIKNFVEKKQKTLVYCPFTSQVNDIYNEVDTSIGPRVKRYHGTLEKIARDTAQNNFKADDCDVMICTKAFGMGVDIKNIQNVYHYAPTGNLADYVQEIGRAARIEDIEGHAITDFSLSDMRYMRTLYGMSEMKQYQLKEIIRKLYDIYREKGRRNLLISPDAFSYLFEEKELENKVKNGLLLISKDLSEIYGFPVINVRPKTMFTKNYVNVPESAEAEFVRKYGKYAKFLQDNTHRILPSRNQSLASDTIVTNSGKVYEVNMSKLWENNFEDMTFMKFKYLFFNGELFDCGSDQKLSPRLHISLNYKNSFEDTVLKLKTYIASLSEVFRKYKNAGKTFTADEFKRDLITNLGDEFSLFEFAGMLLDMFVADISQNIAFNSNSDKLKFISSKKSASGDSLTYRVMNTNYITLGNYFTRLMAQSIPGENGIFRAFIPMSKNGKRPDQMKLLSVLELFGLATYEVNGGKNVEIFVRINDPVKLKRLSHDKYSNNLLTDIKKRHRSAQAIMSRFLKKEFNDEQRWEIIENYFLGREDFVEQCLGE